MWPPLGPWWLLLWLPPLATLPAGATRQEEEAVAALSVQKCTALKEMDVIETSVSNCYCYNQNSQMEWKYMWSTVQMKITSSGLLSIVHITERRNCQYPETILSLIKCVIHNFWTLKESNEITIIINPYGQTVCFSVKPVTKIFIYTISVDRNIVDFKLFIMFVSGVFLFFYAKTLSQSPVFFYSFGTMLGVLMTLVFILLLVKRFVTKYSTFWALMIGCWLASVYAVCRLIEDLKWLWYENRIYVLGLVRITTTRWRRYPTNPPAFCPERMKKWFTSEKLVFKYLTEEEYREQVDAETTRALEELRQACRSPDFPSWLAVSRLQAPKKFADFVLGGSHLSTEEISLHEEQYGLGGAFVEEQLFNLTTDSLPAH
ncbi:Nuclear Envelope Integral Membrane Protein 2 [Manis pentadactyla]|nr:Nuclear Envelope Integral Membrane Protein 2 [Manis pentadactyla]